MLHTALLASLGLTCVAATAILPLGVVDTAPDADNTSEEDKNPFPHREK